jgi:solute carrier family 25 thiamine pyrophosphate transporter 19
MGGEHGARQSKVAALTPGRRRQRPVWHNVVSGMVAGAVSRFVAAPLDLVKIRFQLQAAPIAQTSGGLYKGVVQACQSIYAEEGIRTFWRLVVAQHPYSLCDKKMHVMLH